MDSSSSTSTDVLITSQALEYMEHDMFDYCEQTQTDRISHHQFQAQESENNFNHKPASRNNNCSTTTSNRRKV